MLLAFISFILIMAAPFYDGIGCKIDLNEIALRFKY